MISVRSLASACLALTLVATLTSCTSGISRFGQKPKKEKSDETEPPAAVEEQGSGKLSPSSTETQTLTGQGAIAGSTVTFPPGTIAVDSLIAMEEGGDLSSEVLTELEVDTSVTASGTSVIVDSDNDTDPAGTISISLPAPESAGLSLQGVTLIVVYRVVVKATGEYLTGIIPQSEFTSYDSATGLVTVGSNYFGQFQVLAVDKPVEKKVEKKSSVAGFETPSGDLKPSVAKTPEKTDSTEPTVTLTTSAPATTNLNPVPFKVTFSEAVSEFTATDIAQSSGTVTGFQKNTNGYEFGISGSNDGDLTVSVKDKAAKDAAGNWSKPSNSLKVKVDRTTPKIAFTTASGQLITIPNMTSFALNGTCSEANRTVTILVVGTSTQYATSCNSAGAFTKQLNLTLLPPGNLVIRASITDAAENESHVELTVRGTESLTVAAEHTAAPNWLDHVRNSDKQACTGAESGPYAGESAVCSDGGPLRKVVVHGESSCTGLTLADDLARFDWVCDVVNGKATFHSKLRDGKSLKDFIAMGGTSFLSNFVTVTKSGTGVIGKSTSGAWWANTFAVVTTGGASTLNAPGKIYTVISAISKDQILIGADKIALVVMPGASVQGVPSTTNCHLFTPGGAVNDTCLVHAMDRRFIRVEGAFLADAAPYEIQHGIMISNSKFVTLASVQVEGFGVDSGGSGAFVYGAPDPFLDGLVVDGLKAKNSAGTGLIVQGMNHAVVRDVLSANNGNGGAYINGGVHVVIQRGAFTNNALSGLSFAYAGRHVASEVLAASNSPDGIVVFDSDDVVLQNATVAMNSGAGLSIKQTTDMMIDGIVAFNNNTGFSGLPGNPSSSIEIGKLAELLGGTAYDFNSSNVAATTLSAFALFRHTPGAGGCDTTGVAGTPACDDQSLTSIFDAPTGAASHGGVDFLSVTNWWKNFGIGGQEGSSSHDDNVGRCVSGSCQVYDWSVNATPVQIAFQNGDLANGTACPIDGQTTVVRPGSVTALRFAQEILLDLRGNDNGLCEGGEACVFAPHLGGYIGDGDLSETCTFDSAGGIGGVTLLGYETTTR